MGQDIFEISMNIGKMAFIFIMMIQSVPLLVWVERRGSAFIQNRLGPNRVGPLGLTQLLADAVKFIFKEEFVPPKSFKALFYMAPVLSLLPAAIALGALPLGPRFTLDAFELFGQSWGPYLFEYQSFSTPIGIIFVLGVSSLGAYALLLAGWGSANKYSLFGALRASAQMISYELALGLSLVGALILYGTFDFYEMILWQQGSLNFSIAGFELGIPKWGIFFQPVAAVIFFIATLAETNRAPFDLPEAEAELVAGYHTEYSGLKMLMFYMGEYGHMVVASALMSIFFFGGFDIPFLTFDGVVEFFSGFTSGNTPKMLAGLVFHGAFMAKVVFFLWLFIWIRWTLPRFRYDQLMDIGWKKLLPWALANTVVTAFVYMLVAG